MWLGDLWQFDKISLLPAGGKGLADRKRIPSAVFSTMTSVPTRHRGASRTDFAKITCPFEGSRGVFIDGLARAGTCEAAPLGSPVYSKEELIAKVGAAFLCAEAGISNAVIENQAKAPRRRRRTRPLLLGLHQSTTFVPRQRQRFSFHPCPGARRMRTPRYVTTTTAPASSSSLSRASAMAASSRYARRLSSCGRNKITPA